MGDEELYDLLITLLRSNNHNLINVNGEKKDITVDTLAEYMKVTPAIMETLVNRALEEGYVKFVTDRKANSTRFNTPLEKLSRPRFQKPKNN